MQPDQQELGHLRLDATSVVRFLAMNPDFFNQNSEVLPRLRIPHHTGAAVSLIEKQVSVLRGKCNTLENNLRDLISVARANEQLQQRLHLLIQDIISAPSLEDVLALTRDNLMSNFHADEVHTLLIDRRKTVITTSGTADPKSTADGEATAVSETSDWGRRIVPRNPHLPAFDDVFSAGETQCGALNDAQRAILELPDDIEIASAAVVPLSHQDKLGLVILTSADESRFASGKGVMFLNQLGDVLGRRIHTLI